jgi:hypothetical protein
MTNTTSSNIGLFHEAVGDVQDIIMLKIKTFTGKISQFASKKYRNALHALLMFYGFFLMIFFLIAWTSFLYYIIYSLIMPEMKFESPLYFDFDPQFDGQIINTAAIEQHCNNKLELPIATVFFNRKDRQWQWYSSQSSSSPPPPPPPEDVLDQEQQDNTQQTRYQRTRKEILSRFTEFPGGPPDEEALQRPPLSMGEEYNIWVHLVIPETESNLNLGTFMLNAELINLIPQIVNTNNNNNMEKILARSKRPVTLQYTTSTSRWFRDIILLLWRSFGFAKPEQVVEILLFERWHEDGDPLRVPSSIRVQLSNPKLSITSAKVFFLVELYGIRWFMYHWSFTSFFFFVSFGLAFQSTIGICIALVRITKKVNENEEENQNDEQSEQDEQSSGDDSEQVSSGNELQQPITTSEEGIDPLAE